MSDLTGGGIANRPKSSLLRLRSSGLSIDSYDAKNEIRVLVLYSGGTIGMRSHNGVYIPEPNFLRPALKKLPMFHDPDYAVHNEGEEEEDIPLVMPESKDGKRVIYSICEYDPLLDSANMSIGDYIRIAQDIKRNYELFNGFVVLHGTDTMAYTASALSFMLEFLGKPVILTGSQIPIFETRSDGRDNFLGALIVAGSYVIPEVCIYFHNKLLRGNRSTKVDSGAMDAFQSPNMHPLAELEVNIKVHWKAVYRPTKNGKFTIQDLMCTNVGLLRFFPSITAQTVKAFLQPPMQGVVLQSYGAGNGPDTREDILEILLEATSRDVVIVNITQCARGKVSAAYASGQALMDAGVIPGADMTPEAALMKLSYVLSKEEWSPMRKREQMQKNLRGELTGIQTDVEEVQLSIIDKLSKTLKMSTDQEVELLKASLFPSLACAAARRGDIDRLKLLAEAGADLKLGDHDNRTPLHVACASGHVDTVEYLIEQGAFLHLKDRYGHMAIDDAVRFAQLDVVDVLVSNGGKLMLNYSKIQAYLCHAIVHEKLENLEAWHRAGADMNLTDHYGKSPLHLACNLGKLQQVKDMLKFGANPDLKDVYGITPLDEAVKNKHTGIVEFLTKYSNNAQHV